MSESTVNVSNTNYLEFSTCSFIQISQFDDIMIKLIKIHSVHFKMMYVLCLHLEWLQSYLILKD